MSSLKVENHLPNVKNYANTASTILRDLIEKHNKLVDEHEKLKIEVEENRAKSVFGI